MSDDLYVSSNFPTMVPILLVIDPLGSVPAILAFALIFFASFATGRSGFWRLPLVAWAVPVVGFAWEFHVLFVQGVWEMPDGITFYVVAAMLIHLLIALLAPIAFALGRRARRAVL